MSYQNFNTNIIDSRNYSSNKFESINISSNFKIDSRKVEDYKGEYKEASIFAKILILFFF